MSSENENVWAHDAFTFRRLMMEFFDHFDTGRLAVGKSLSFADHQLVRGFVNGARRELESTNHRYLGEDDDGNLVDGNGNVVDMSGWVEN